MPKGILISAIIPYVHKKFKINFSAGAEGAILCPKEPLKIAVNCGILRKNARRNCLCRDPEVADAAAAVAVAADFQEVAFPEAAVAASTVGITIIPITDPMEDGAMAVGTMVAVVWAR